MVAVSARCAFPRQSLFEPYKHLSPEWSGSISPRQELILPGFFFARRRFRCFEKGLGRLVRSVGLGLSLKKPFSISVGTDQLLNTDAVRLGCFPLGFQFVEH
jgi:hypothetical protein